MNESIGLGAAVLSALSWAISIVWFQAAIDRFGAGACNLLKAVIGAVAFSAVWALRLSLGATTMPEPNVVYALVISGIIGFALGDLAFFAAIKLIEARLATLWQSTYPLLLLVISFFIGDGRLESLEIVGVILVVLGVLDVSRRQGRTLHVGGRVLFFGILCGLGAATGQAVGLVITDGVMDGIDVLSAAAIRISGAAAALLLGYIVRGRGAATMRLLTNREFLKLAIGPITLGTIFGISMMMVAIDLARPAPAGALMSLTPVFLVPLTTLVRGEPFDGRVLMGTAIAVAGVIAIASAQA